MLPTLQIGPGALPTRAVLMLIAAFVCLAWAEQRMPRHGLHKDIAYTTGYLFGGVTLVAGRLWYAATHWTAYESNLLGLVGTSPSTIAFTEGAAAGCLAVLTYLWVNQISLAAFADAFTPGLLAMFALASLGALASGDAYGAPSDVPWAISLWDARRHPSQVYEILVAIVPLAAVMRARSMPTGSSFLAAAAMYSVGRVFVEAFRGDSWLIAEGVRGMQVIWLSAALTALLLLGRRTAAPNQ